MMIQDVDGGQLSLNTSSHNHQQQQDVLTVAVPPQINSPDDRTA
jgi:hypothetical protein